MRIKRKTETHCFFVFCFCYFFNFKVTWDGSLTRRNSLQGSFHPSPKILAEASLSPPHSSFPSSDLLPQEPSFSKLNHKFPFSFFSHSKKKQIYKNCWECEIQFKCKELLFLLFSSFSHFVIKRKHSPLFPFLSSSPSFLFLFTLFFTHKTLNLQDSILPSMHAAKSKISSDPFQMWTSISRRTSNCSECQLASVTEI